jgi:tetratricopeptide (TPR) repeat protein
MTVRTRTILLLACLVALSACTPVKKQVKEDPGQAAAVRSALVAFNKGVDLLQGRKADYFKAVEYFEKAVELRPDFYEAQFNLGLLFARGNDFAQSSRAYIAALNAKPGDRAAAFNLADLYRNNRRFDEAIDILEAIVRKNSDDFEARNNLAVLLRMKGEYDKATAQARYVLDRDPKQVLAYNNLATIFSEKKEHEMAEDLFRRALALDPDNSRVLNNKALAKRNQQKVQEALELFHKAFEKNKKIAEAGLNAASVYMDSADYERAAQTYMRIVQFIPGYLPALVGHAVATRGMGQYKKAEKSYQQILGLDHTNPDALFNLGLLYMNHREKPAWACEAFHRFLKSGRASQVLAKRAKGYIEDIKLSNPKACKEGEK